MKSPTNPRYWIRYSVPPHQVDRAIDELMGLWRKKQIDGALIFAAGLEERGQGLNTIEELREWRAEVEPLFAALRENKIPWGINVWQTIGFTRFAPGLRRKVPFQHVIGHDGTPAEEWACPLDQGFVAHVADIYGTLVESHPAMIWIDDDFRYFGRNPAPMPCFCPLHLAAMRKLTGHKYSRQSLLKAIGDPNHELGRIRKAWLKVQYESLADIAEGIRKRVKKVSPATKVGLMTGGLEHRALDGWDWDDLIKRIWPKGEAPRIRPGYGFYSGGDPRPYLMGTVYPRHQQALVPKNAELWPEIENYPGTIFARSNRTMAMQMCLASFFGMGHDHTLSVTGMMGNPIDDSLPIFAALHKLRPMLAEINRAVADHPQETGLKLLMHPGVGVNLDMSKEPIWQWPMHRPWDYVLPPMGFPVGFRVPENVVSVGTGGPLARTLGKKELAKRMKNGMYVDGTFAAVLAELGVAPIDVQPPEGGAAFEEISDPAFGRVNDIISLRQTPRLWRINPGKHGKVVSWCCDHAGKHITPGLVLFDLGKTGRVAVTSIDAQLLTDVWTYFRSPARKRQLEATMSWLGNVPGFVRDHPDVFPLVRTGKKGTLLGIANLRDDPWTSVTVDLLNTRTPRRVLLLDESGKWRSVKFTASRVGKKLRLKLPGVPVMSPLAVWRLEA